MIDQAQTPFRYKSQLLVSRVNFLNRSDLCGSKFPYGRVCVSRTHKNMPEKWFIFTSRKKNAQKDREQTAQTVFFQLIVLIMYAMMCVYFYDGFEMNAK